MRSFINRYYHHEYKYPVKMWQSAVINGRPHVAVYDGAVLRLIDLSTRKVLKSHEYHQINTFSESLFVNSKIFRYDQLFFFAFKQRFIKAFDNGLNEIEAINFDTGMAIIALHWDPDTSYLYVAGTNGWLKCFHLISHARVTEFDAEWHLVFEIRSTEDWIVSLAHDSLSQTLYGVANTTLYAWELGTGVFKFRLPDLHEKYRLCQVAVLPGSNFVATSALDGTVKIWNVQISVCKMYFVIPSFSLGYISFDVMERFIMTNSSDRVIRLFRIGNEDPLCQISLADETKKPSFDEVIIVGIQAMAVNSGKDGFICVTSYKSSFDAVAIGFAPEDYITSSYPIKRMAYLKEREELLCICENNLMITKDKTYDLDMITDDKAKRSPASETMTVFLSDNDKLITGHKNGLIKVIEGSTLEGMIIETVDLDDSIVAIDVVKGMFVRSHQNCGHEQRAADDDQNFIVAFSKNGVVNVWCEKCGMPIVDQKLNKRNVKQVKAVEKENIILIAFENSVAIYSTNGYSFSFVCQISTSGNQTVTAFDITDDLKLIIGTSSGEVVISELEREEGKDEFNITIKEILVPNCCPVMKVFIVPGKRICACAFKDGLIYLFEFDRMITLSSEIYTDADQLSSVIFEYSKERDELQVYMAFTLHVHCYNLSLEVPEIKEVVEEPEPEEEHTAVEEEVPEFEPVDLSFITQPENTTDISKLFAEEKKQKRKHTVTDIVDIKSKTVVEDLPAPKPKLTLEEVIAKNEAKVAQILGTGENKKKPKLATAKKRAKTSLTPRVQPRQHGLDLTLSNFSYKNVPKPISMSELKKTLERSEESSVAQTFSSRENSSMSQATATTKTLTLTVDSESPQTTMTMSGDYGSYEGEEFETNDLMYPTEPGTWMMIKKHKEQPTVIPLDKLQKKFIAPPQSFRVLFDDEKTLNSLSFYDPRGFSATFETEEEREKKRLEAERKKEEEAEAKKLAKTAKPPPPVKKPEPQPVQRAQTSVERKRPLYPMVHRTQSEKHLMSSQTITKPVQSTIPSRFVEAEKQKTKSQTVSKPVKKETAPAVKPVEKKEPKPPIIITTEKKTVEKKEAKPTVKKIIAKQHQPTVHKETPTVQQQPSTHKEAPVQPSIAFHPKTVAQTTAASFTAQHVKENTTTIDMNSFTADLGFPELTHIEAKPKKRQKKETTFTHVVAKKKEPEKRVFVDKKITIKKKESEFAKLKTAKVSSVYDLKPKKLKSKDINAAVKAVMHSTKSDKKTRRAKSAKVENKKPIKVEEKVEEKPKEEKVTQKVQKETKEVITKPAAKEEAEEPQLKRKARKWIDNGVDFGFQADLNIENNEKEMKFAISDFLPNLSPLWEQKHIYPNLPIDGVSHNPPKRFCINESNLDNVLPDVKPRPFFCKDFLSDFEAIYASQSGMAEGEDKCLADENAKERNTGIESFRVKKRRTSF